MSVKGRRLGMAKRRMGLGPALMMVLSSVVIIQSAALAWMILRAPDREAIMADLRSRPVETVVDMCLPAEA
jgi:hypothetical protein